MLVAEGMGQHVGKGYIYFAMAFRLRRVSEHALPQEDSSVFIIIRGRAGQRERVRLALYLPGNR
jgi:hypothetical protein